MFLKRMRHNSNKTIKFSFNKLFIDFLFIAFFLAMIISSKLIGVIQVNRHGAKTPEKFEELSSKLFLGAKPNRLSFKGLSQLHLLGNYMRQKYICNENEYYNILSKDFNKKEFQIYASTAERSIFSSFAFIGGFYPNSEMVLNFIKKSENYTISKNNSNLNTDFMSSDILPIVTLPIDDNLQKRNISKIMLNVFNPEIDSIFNSKFCKVKIGESNKSPIYSNNTLKELIKLDNNKENFTDLFNITEMELNYAVEEIKSNFPVAFSDEFIFKEKTIDNQYKKDIHINETNTESGKKDEFARRIFLRKVNNFINSSKNFFGKNLFNLSLRAQQTLDKVQLEIDYLLNLSSSKYLKLLHSRMFYELKKILSEFFENSKLNNKKKLKFVVFLAHDINIMGIFSSILEKNFILEKLRNFEENLHFLHPPYASHFIIELHSTKNHNHFLNSKNTEYFLRFIYNGKNITEGLNKNYFKYKKNLDGFEFKNFMNFLDSRIDLEFNNLKCPYFKK